MINEEKIQESTEPKINQKEPSKCNQFMNRFIKFPEMTFEKIVRAVILISGTIFMIISCFTGAAYSRYKIDCLDDMSHIITSSINDFFYKDAIVFNMLLKFIISLLIDLLIIYTLIVWSLFSSNIRLLSTGISYMIINLLVRFLHIQKQPENSAFTIRYIFSIFVNYKITTYSFYPVVMGILIICAFEWKRNNNEIMFWIFICLFTLESIILIIMQGNYFHEIFTAGVFGHYLFIINEKILEIIYGEDYLSVENSNISFNISNANTMDNSEKNNENKNDNGNKDNNNNDDNVDNELPKSKQIEIESNDNNDNSEENTE